jgi:hypothetical protein
MPTARMRMTAGTDGKKHDANFGMRQMAAASGRTTRSN